MAYKNVTRKKIARKKTVFILSCIVTFLTVYSLVLPAITIDHDTAEEDNGIFLNENNLLEFDNRNSFDDQEDGDLEKPINDEITEDTAATNAEFTEPDELYVIQNTDEQLYPPVIFSECFEDVLVYVDAPEGAFPERTKLVVQEAIDASIEADISDVVDQKEISSYKAIDIAFIWNNIEIEPLQPIKVSITSAFISEKDKDPLLVHIDNEGNAKEIETKSVEQSDIDLIINNDNIQDLIDNNDAIEEVSKENTLFFESDSFSVYVLVYTVDFHYEVDGKVFDYSINGGDAVLLSELLELLDISKGDNDSLVSDIVDVRFSDPSLINVSYAENDTTVDEIKLSESLNCEYSDLLRENDIRLINEKAVHQGDWILISLKPFDSKESLIVDLENGDSFEIAVTDGKIQRTYISASGDAFDIVVTYDENSGIPFDASLDVREIDPNSSEHIDYLNKTIEFLRKNRDYEPSIQFAKFFDISITDKDGTRIELSSPVDVKIQYSDKIDIGYGISSVIHFAEDGTELIDPVITSDVKNANGSATVFEYSQNSFSGIGTITETASIADGQYFIISGYNENQYALDQNGNAVKVKYYFASKQVEALDGTDENTLLWTVKNVGSNYYTFTAKNGKHIILNGNNVVGTDSVNILAEWIDYDPNDQTSIGNGYHLYSTKNPWDQNTWKPLSFNDNPNFLSGNTASQIRLAKYSIVNDSGDTPEVDTYTGREVNPEQLDEWLMTLFDDMPVGWDGYHKTAEVYDYENRMYQIDFTAESNAQGFSSDVDIAFSIDMSNSMLFPSTLTEIGTIEMNQSVLEASLDKSKVYFVIADIASTSTVNAVFYENGKWKYEDASKYARGQRGGTNQDYVVPNSKTKIQGTDTGIYTLYTAEQGYLDYINGNGTVYDNPYNRLADTKESLRMAFNFLDVMQEKYHAKIRVGWNGFARDVQYDNGKTGKEQEKFDYRCRENGHDLKDLSEVDYRDILNGITQAGNQTGGGTRPDKAFDDAANMGWSSTAQKYLILITDGAPQGGGASTPQVALDYGKNQGRQLTATHGVNIIPIGLSTEHVTGANNLFQYIAFEDENGKMIYQAKDGDALKSSVVDTLRILVSKAITVGTIKDTIDPVFYPVSTDGTPLKANDKIDLNGKLTTDTSKPYGIIGYDGQNWNVEWKDQDIVWPDKENPYGWHGRVIVKAKENFLGGNDISTNVGKATLDVKNAKVLDSNGQWMTISFGSLMDIKPEQLQTRYMDTPHVNIDELEMTKNDTEWTVYLNTEVDPGSQMKALFNEIRVLKVVSDGEHEMIIENGKTARDVMVYDLIPKDNEPYDYQKASSDTRDKKSAEDVFFLKDLFTMKDSLGNDFISDNISAEQAVNRLIAGERIELQYQGYGHSNVGKIILELKADPSAKTNNPNKHNASPEGNAVEEYILSVEYKPNESSLSERDWNTGTFGTKDKGKETEDKTKSNAHVINVIKDVIKIIKTDFDGNVVKENNASFEIYQKDDAGNKINVATVSTNNGEYLWDYIAPDEDQKTAGQYWKNLTNFYIREVKAPEGYALFDEEISVRLTMSESINELVNSSELVDYPYNWIQGAEFSAYGDNDYVSVATDEILLKISIKNDKCVDIDVIKTDQESKNIAGAKFKLIKGSVLPQGMSVYIKGSDKTKPENKIVVIDGVFEIPFEGATITGLGVGEYTLTEISAPTGYVYSGKPIRFRIDRSGAVIYLNPEDNPAPDVTTNELNTEYKIQNEAGKELPHTGGVGTKIFEMSGLMLMTGSILYMLSKRKSR